MHNRNELYKEFEQQIDALIFEKNLLIQGIRKESTHKSIGVQGPLSDPHYREQCGFRNGLAYAKQILRGVVHDAQRGDK